MYINYHLVKKINKKLIEKSNIYKKINFSYIIKFLVQKYTI